MSADSSWELQKAIYAALTGDGALMAMITGVHDHVPQEADFPYVTIGEGTTTFIGRGSVELTLVLHVWSRARGRKEAKQILVEINRILNEANLTVPGFVLMWLFFDFSRTLLDSDGATYHGITRYSAKTYPA